MTTITFMAALGPAFQPQYSCCKPILMERESFASWQKSKASKYFITCPNLPSGLHVAPISHPLSWFTPLERASVSSPICILTSLTVTLKPIPPTSTATWLKQPLGSRSPWPLPCLSHHQTSQVFDGVKTAPECFIPRSNSLAARRRVRRGYLCR